MIMKHNILSQFIMNCFLISLCFIIDYLSNQYFTFLKIPFCGHVFKISFLILFSVGYLFGFRNALMVCLGYGFYHILRSIPDFIKWRDAYHLTSFQIFGSVLLDYLIPDLLIISSAFLFYRFSFLRLYLVLFIVLFVKMMFGFFSGLWIFRQVHEYKKDIDFMLSSNKFFFGNMFSSSRNLYYCFCFYLNFVPNFITFLVSSVFFTFFHRFQLKENLFD